MSAKEQEPNESQNKRIAFLRNLLDQITTDQTDEEKAELQGDGKVGNVVIQPTPRKELCQFEKDSIQAFIAQRKSSIESLKTEAC